MTRVLYLIRGLPGVGKSTLAALITREGRVGVHLEADKYRYVDGDYVFKPEDNARVHEMCQNDCGHFMKMGVSPIVVANTFVRSREMDPYYTLADTYGYVVSELTITTTHTVRELAARNIHGVPVETIAKMQSNWEN